MKNKNLKALTITGLIVASTGLAIIAAKPARADLWCWPGEENCEVDGVPGTSGNTIFGNPRSSDDGDSCLQVMTNRSYKFNIKNGTSTTISYNINGQQYQLNPGGSKPYTFPAARGTNSCNVESLPKPTITYDGYRRPGYQEIRLSLNNGETYEFADYDSDHIAFYLR